MAGILGVFCKSIYHIKGCPSPCHAKADSWCQSPDWKSPQPGRAISRNSCEEGCVQGTSHLAPLQSMSKLGHRACIAAMSDSKRAGSEPARHNVWLGIQSQVELSGQRSGAPGRRKGGKGPAGSEDTFSQRCEEGKWIESPGLPLLLLGFPAWVAGGHELCFSERPALIATSLDAGRNRGPSR